MLLTGPPVRCYSEPVHVRQWVAFVRKIGEAAATSAGYPVRWEPLGPWQHG